ncbi:MAG: hypothetical protein KDB22_28745, partial [Planctomycetales bacterium]|nr:hypothetical protein [Planctomycetales bacterium]
LRDSSLGANGSLADLNGGYFPFPTTRIERDSRVPLDERYTNRSDYFSKYAVAITKLTEQRFLLAEDALRMLDAAARRDPFQSVGAASDRAE